MEKPVKVLRGADMFPLKKGDLAIIRHTYTMLRGPGGEFYLPVRVGRGGKKPREENNSPIDTWRVAAVIRPGWKVAGDVFGDTVEEVIQKVWEAREE